MNLTPETKHFINAARLKLFKKNAVLLNCARGELVDSAALAAAAPRPGRARPRAGGG